MPDKAEPDPNPDKIELHQFGAPTEFGAPYHPLVFRPIEPIAEEVHIETPSAKVRVVKPHQSFWAHVADVLFGDSHNRG